MATRVKAVTRTLFDIINSSVTKLADGTLLEDQVTAWVKAVGVQRELAVGAVNVSEATTGGG